MKKKKKKKKKNKNKNKNKNKKNKKKRRRRRKRRIIAYNTAMWQNVNSSWRDLCSLQESQNYTP